MQKPVNPNVGTTENLLPKKVAPAVEPPTDKTISTLQYKVVNIKGKAIRRSVSFYLDTPNCAIKNFECLFQTKTDAFRPLPDVYLEDLTGNRLLSQRVIEKYGIHRYYRTGWDWYAFPIVDAHWNYQYTKLKKTPFGKDGQPKSFTLPRGMVASLYPLPLLFSLDPNKGKENIIFLCEGETDALALISRGHTALTSTHGVGTFPSAFLEYFPAKCRVICAFDRDEAGEKAVAKTALLFHQLRPDITFQRFKFPTEMPGKDIGDYLSWKYKVDNGANKTPEESPHLYFRS